MEYCKCNVCDCYNGTIENRTYCLECVEHHGCIEPRATSFAEGMNKAFQTMEERLVTLEADVKRLKRELGLK